jgi:hypothetical protein
MALEVRTRITVILPYPANQYQLFSLHSALDKLTELCGGITVSSLPDAGNEGKIIFLGRWIDPETKQTLNEPAILILADAPFALNDAEFHERLETMKVKCQHGFNQRVIWLTIHRLDRIASHDYV